MPPITARKVASSCDLSFAEIDRPTLGALQHHVVEPDRGALARRGDLVGPLIDDAKAHILQHRHAVGQRDGTIVAPDLQADPPPSGSSLEIGTARHVDGEAFHRPQIVDDDFRRIGAAITCREGFAITRLQLAGARRVEISVQRLAEGIAPAAHDALDRALEFGAIRVWSRGAAPADDKEHADIRAFREVRIIGADMALIDARKIVADRNAGIGSRNGRAGYRPITETKRSNSSRRASTRTRGLPSSCSTAMAKR